MEGAGVFDVDGRSICTGLLSVLALEAMGCQEARWAAWQPSIGCPTPRLASLNLQGLNLLSVGVKERPICANHAPSWARGGRLALLEPEGV